MRSLFFILLLAPTYFFSQEIKINLVLDSLLGKTKPESIYDTDLLPPSFFSKNREALRDAMPKNSVAILFSNPIRNRSNDVDYEYHQDPNFYYLTGLREPHAAVIIYKEEQEFKNNLTTNEILFLQKREKQNELWTGKRLGVDAAILELGINTAMENEKFLSFENEYEHFEKILVFEAIDDVKNTLER